MIAVIHMLVGAMCGVLLQSAPGVVVVSFFSHYLLDRVPHIDPETFAKKNIPYSWMQLITLLSDTVLTLVVASLFFLTHKRWALILLGITAALLPDILLPLEKYTFMTPLKRLHQLFHWDTRYAAQRPWYVVGLVAPVIVGLAASAVLWFTY